MADNKPIKINHLSDFIVTEHFKKEEYTGVPFRYTYFTRQEQYVASWDGEEYINCKRKADGSITIAFNAHHLGIGLLRVMREYFIPDLNFEDGIRNVVDVEDTGILLVNGESDRLSVDMEVVPPYIQLQIVDALTDASPTKALSANQGRVLSERIETLSEAMITSISQEATKRTEADTALSQQLAETGKTLEHLKNKDAELDDMITAVIMQTSYAKDIGLFKTATQAEDAAIMWAGAPGIRFIFYATEEGQIGTIRQVYSSEGYTLQFLDRDGAQYVRIVYYDANLKSAWRPIDRASIVYKLMYTASSRRLEFHDPIHDEGFGGITLPEATTAQSGLMTAAQVQNLDAAVKTSGAQAIAGVKTFNDNISIAGKTTIAKNIDGGEFKVLHKGSSKGFIVRTRNTADSVLPLELLTTNGVNAYTYAFPAKGGTVALTDDVTALGANIKMLQNRVETLGNYNTNLESKFGRLEWELNEKISALEVKDYGLGQNIQELDAMIKSPTNRLGRIQDLLSKLETALGTTDLDAIVSHLTQ